MRKLFTVRTNQQSAINNQQSREFRTKHVKRDLGRSCLRDKFPKHHPPESSLFPKKLGGYPGDPLGSKHALRITALQTKVAGQCGSRRLPLKPLRFV